MEEKRYADVFIYVPAVREIVRIAEGNGTNLLDEDEAEGYISSEPATQKPKKKIRTKGGRL